MNATLIADALSPLALGETYVISHGRGGAVGAFHAQEPGPYVRGERVLVQSPRGVEVGTVLRAATARQARLLGPQISGEILRRLNADDQPRLDENSAIEQKIFEQSRAWAAHERLAMDVLDVELLFDGAQAIVQFVGEDHGIESFAGRLEEHFQMAIRLENVAVHSVVEHDHDEHGCGKPDCGKSEGGGCSSCGTGGCSSCGTGVDLREYFGHLRSRMDADQRTPLV